MFSYYAFFIHNFSVLKVASFKSKTDDNFANYFIKTTVKNK